MLHAPPISSCFIWPIKITNYGLRYAKSLRNWIFWFWYKRESDQQCRSSDGMSYISTRLLVAQCFLKKIATWHKICLFAQQSNTPKIRIFVLWIYLKTISVHKNPSRSTPLAYLRTRCWRVRRKSELWYPPVTRTIQLLTFRTLSILPSFILKQLFGDWTLSPSSGKKTTEFAPTDGADPYLQTPDSTQDKIRIYV